jgi:hypothetical protein
MGCREALNSSWIITKGVVFREYIMPRKTMIGSSWLDRHLLAVLLNLSDLRKERHLLLFIIRGKLF